MTPARTLDVEEAERIELLVELLDPRQEVLEHVGGTQLARAHPVGQLPRVALPHLVNFAHAFPLSAVTAGPLGPRSLLGGIPTPRRSLIVPAPRRRCRLSSSALAAVDV